MENLRKIIAGLVAIAAGLVFSHHAHAGAPIPMSRAPGFCRLLLGDFEIVALADGTVNLLARKLLTNTAPTKVDVAQMHVARARGGSS